jgi:hypothetical protein
MYRITGIGTYGPEVPSPATKEGRFKFWFPSPPAMNSVIVYTAESGRDPAVVEGSQFTEFDIQHPDVHTFIRGGHYFACEGSGYLHDALIAAGYGCEAM